MVVQLCEILKPLELCTFKGSVVQHVSYISVKLLFFLKSNATRPQEQCPCVMERWPASLGEGSSPQLAQGLLIFHIKSNELGPNANH